MIGEKSYLLQLGFPLCSVSDLIIASSLGVIKGIYGGIPTNRNLPKKLLINNFFNSVGKETSRFG
jgi:hypothetical protein